MWSRLEQWGWIAVIIAVIQIVAGGLLFARKVGGVIMAIVHRDVRHAGQLPLDRRVPGVVDRGDRLQRARAVGGHRPRRTSSPERRQRCAGHRADRGLQRRRARDRDHAARPGDQRRPVRLRPPVARAGRRVAVVPGLRHELPHDRRRLAGAPRAVQPPARRRPGADAAQPAAADGRLVPAVPDRPDGRGAARLRRAERAAVVVYGVLAA